MHQQIRTIIGRTDSNDGSGAMSSESVEGDPLEVSPGGLHGLLDLLAREGYNLCLAGGTAIEGGGEFVFAVDHEDGDNRTAECAAMLRSEGYQRVRVVSPHVCWLENRPGALRDCLGELRDEGREVRELFVGTPRDGNILVHVTTLRRQGIGRPAG